MNAARKIRDVPLDIIEAVADAANVGVHSDGTGGYGCSVPLADGRRLVLLSAEGGLVGGVHLGTIGASSPFSDAGVTA